MVFLKFLQRCDAHVHCLGVARKFIEFFAFESCELRDFISGFARGLFGGARILLCAGLLRLRRRPRLRRLLRRRRILHRRRYGGVRFYCGKCG